jgi:hypothetical protein
MDYGIGDGGSSGGGGGGVSSSIARYPALSWNFPATNPAVPDTATGTNRDIKYHIFPDTGSKTITLQTKTPDKLDPNGLVSFWFCGVPITPAAAGTVFDLKHANVINGNTWDKSYTSLTTGIIPTVATVKGVQIYNWTALVSTLTWLKNQMLFLAFERSTGDAGDTLPGNYGFMELDIDYSRA